MSRLRPYQGVTDMRLVPILVVAVLSAGALAPGVARAQAPAPNFELKPVEGGFLRLDRNSGLTAFCRPAGDGYACRPTAEDGQAGAALVAELEKRVAALEKRMKELGGDPAAPQAKRDPTMDLPSDEQVDRVATFLERALKRFKQLAIDMQKEGGAL